MQRGARRRALVAVICLLLLAADYGVILEGQLQWRSPPQTKTAGIDWKTWSAEAVEEARRVGHPVLVDFTAKSCLTCKLNLASSLEIDRTRAKLRQIGAVAFKADTPGKTRPLGGNSAASTLRASRWCWSIRRTWAKNRKSCRLS